MEIKCLVMMGFVVVMNGYYDLCVVFESLKNVQCALIHFWYGINKSRQSKRAFHCFVCARKWSHCMVIRLIFILAALKCGFTSLICLINYRPSVGVKRRLKIARIVFLISFFVYNSKYIGVEKRFIWLKENYSIRNF